MYLTFHLCWTTFPTGNAAASRGWIGVAGWSITGIVLGIICGPSSTSASESPTQLWRVVFFAGGSESSTRELADIFLSLMIISTESRSTKTPRTIQVGPITSHGIGSFFGMGASRPARRMPSPSENKRDPQTKMQIRVPLVAARRLSLLSSLSLIFLRMSCVDDDLWPSSSCLWRW